MLSRWNPLTPVAGRGAAPTQDGPEPSCVDAACVLAVDLGATHIRAALVGDDGSIVTRVKARTAAEPGTDAGDRVAAVLEAIGVASATRAVVGVPGRVDYETGLLEQANNLPASWCETLSSEALSRRIGLPVALASDADLAAVGEAYFGAGAGAAEVAYLTVSSGVGAGAVSRGRLLRGGRKLVEIGNLVVDHDAFARGEPCTFDELASGRALERAIADAGLQTTPRGLEELDRAGDAHAAAIRRRFVAIAAVAALNVAHCYAPDVIVLGGAVGLGEPLLIAEARRALDLRGPRHLGRPPEVRHAQLGDDAALAGAAAWQTAVGGAQ